MKNDIIKRGEITVECRTYGAELISMKKNGKEYIWQGDPKYWKGQNPILFPVLCSLKEGKVTVDGVTYEMPKHGFARHSDFEVTKKSESSITYTLTSSDQTEKVYPGQFVFNVTHSVSDKGFVTTFEVVNNGKSTMHFHIGGHTGINVPLNGKYSFSDYSVIFDGIEHATNYKAPTGGLIVNPEGSHDLLDGADRIKLDYELFKNDALMLADLKSENARLVDPDGKGVTMNFKGFSALGIWTPSAIDSPFLCLEPWNGLPAFINESGRFEDKPYAIHLPAGEKYTASFSVDIID